MSIKISFMHYMKWTRVTIPIVSVEFEMFYIFSATFFFSLSLEIGKKPSLAKIWGECSPLPALSPHFLWACLVLLFQLFLQLY